MSHLLAPVRLFYMRPLLRALPPFDSMFERATNLELNRLFAVGAQVLAENMVFQSKPSAASGIDKLGIDLSKPLKDPLLEFKAQQMMWHDSATLSVQKIMEALSFAGICSKADIMQRIKHSKFTFHAAHVDNEKAVLETVIQAIIQEPAFLESRSLRLHGRYVLIQSNGAQTKTQIVVPDVLVEAQSDLLGCVEIGDKIWTQLALQNVRAVKDHFVATKDFVLPGKTAWVANGVWCSCKTETSKQWFAT